MYQAALQTSSGAGGSWSVAWDCSASPRNYNYKRYYQPGTGRYVSLDPVREGNSYAYVLNNPIRNLDPYAEVTIVVHGTFAHGSEWSRSDSKFSIAAGRFFGDDRVVSFSWCGSNNSFARFYAGYRLKEFIDQIRERYGPNEPINVIAHSHGGNVVKWATQLGATLDRAVNLGTPQNGTTFDKSKVGRITNVYSRADKIQVYGGNAYVILGNEFGPAGRIDPQAEDNIGVNSGKFSIFDPIDPHSGLHDTKVLSQIILVEKLKAP